MCGIVGYVGPKEALGVLLPALKRLEYRGYDSAGIAVIRQKDIDIYKDKGRIKDLEKSLSDIHGNIGIGHTRWATYGVPSKLNAHPHTDCKGDFAVVHNGIIENYVELKRDLIKRGHEFVSDTDTEVIVHLMEDHYDGDLKDALVKAVAKLKGSYAITAMHREHPKELAVMRNLSPLVLGVGEGENLVASDIPAVLGHTNRVIYLNDGEGAMVRDDSIDLFDETGNKLEAEITSINWTLDDAEKGGYEHFMLKEIYEQPQAIREAILGKMKKNGEVFVSPILNGKIESIKIIACGTSYHAGLVGKYIISHLTGIPCSVEIASEYRYLSPTRDSPLEIFITQSGETADTLAAARESIRRGLTTLAITNVLGSSITREVNDVVYTNAGPEISVAATKSFIAQLVVFYLIGIQLGQVNSTITPSQARHLYKSLRKMPRAVEKIIRNVDSIKKIANEISCASTIFFIGRNINYPIALEGALKLKEISYIHGQGYPAGELKHGPLALLDKDKPVIAIAPDDFLYEKMSSNIGEVLARDAPVICIVSEDDTEMEKFVNHVLRIPKVEPLLTPIPITVILQLLAYYCALERDCSIDKPKNLAKSVTVE
ncbi:MAG: glutamine--fructose-6-phosphate transaminase (isomerizing) [Candidatus Thermoplasmatota archaeon]|jgi:glucosamine--fructose-6-phosphate aminotransferase (isomerizing)|nr:glutamine--fructose-6-phosphate transaminase (isomerizing) [Candidatus Thermoplasmatota archaeon]MDP7264634.1 glutamine--fructose-6-phosphate transaminase (isomerizing) [Candidatus Thermoplasmatota archaeon]